MRMTSSQNEFELENRDSSESNDQFNLDDSDFEIQGLTSNIYKKPPSTSRIQIFLNIFPSRITKLLSRRTIWNRSRRRPGRGVLGYPIILGRRTRLFFNSVAGIIAILLVFTAIFRPSYTHPPPHYEHLRKTMLASNDYGRGNSGNQKIFIAASIYDKGGHLVKGAWGRNLLELLDLLGNRNTFLSVYENDSGEESQKALKEFEEKVQCNSKLVYEEHLPLKNIPRVTLPDGTKRIKRIAYLAEVRNKALQPLENSDIKYDKVLFLNDVVFDPIDAVQLLFSTNANEHGEASYHAACAVDFINPFKFYDTFATRDIEGYSMGVPFFPWFSTAGKGLSRQDVLDGKDAVRVKSCWGGMVAFDAKFLQPAISESAVSPAESNILGSAEDKSVPETQQWDLSHPIRFRAEPALDWDASECCLIHADIIGATKTQTAQQDTGIYQNPFVRVAYGSGTLWFLPFTRRFEKLYTVPHRTIDYLVGLPWPNPRRKASEGEGAGVDRGGYCGMRTLQLLREEPRKGEKNWEIVTLPTE